MSNQATELPNDLTDEEREALNYQEPAEDVNASEQQAEQADPDAAPAEADGADPAAAEPAAGADDAQPAAAADADPAPAAELVAEVAEQPQAAPTPAPILIADAPADAQTQLDKIAADKAALLDQYENGEITAKELHTQQDALNEQAFELKQQLREAALAQKIAAQQAQNTWDTQCRTFLDAHPEYHDAAGKERFAALDEAIKVMARLPVNQGISGDKLIQKAHNMVRAAYGEAPESTTAAPQKVAQPKVPKPAIPPTNIGKLPAADANDTNGGEFAALDSLAKGADVEAYETALSKLSDTQRARYMAR